MNDKNYGISLRLSRPARGAWIETHGHRSGLEDNIGRAPHGARGLKLRRNERKYARAMVAPRTGRVD